MEGTVPREMLNLISDGGHHRREWTEERRCPGPGQGHLVFFATVSNPVGFVHVVLGHVEEPASGRVASGAESGSESIGVRARNAPRLFTAPGDRLVDESGVAQGARHVYVLERGASLIGFDKSQKQPDQDLDVSTVAGDLHRKANVLADELRRAKLAILLAEYRQAGQGQHRVVLIRAVPVIELLRRHSRIAGFCAERGNVLVPQGVGALTGDTVVTDCSAVRRKLSKRIVEEPPTVSIPTKKILELAPKRSDGGRLRPTR